MFFLLSGALFFRNYTNKLYFKKLKSRFKSLVIPYLFWNSLPLISLFFAFLVSKDYNGTLGSTNWFLAIFHHECNVTFWFIFDLIIFIIIAPLINVFLNNKSIAIVTLFLLILLREFGIEIPENIFFRSDSIIFYFLGCIVGKFYIVFFAKQEYSQKLFGFAVAIFVLCNIFTNIVGDNDIWALKFLNTFYLFIYIASFWIISNSVVNRVKNRDLYSYSFMIYALHVKISLKISSVIYQILPKQIFCSVVNFFITFVLTVVLIVLLSKLLKRFTPYIYGFISGSR